MVGVVIFIIFMPETRGRSLEDIQIGFQRPAQTMMSTLFRRWGLGRRDHEGSPEASLPSDGHELTTPSAETPEASDGAVMASSVSVASAARGLRVAAV
jgi:hypothetical protein